MPAFRFPHLTRRLASAALAALAIGLGAAPAFAEEGLNDSAWKPGAQWMSVRFGYAKERGRFSPNGNVGYGFGYSRMVSERLSLGANLQHDLLGKFSGSALIAMPFTVEALWHFHWSPTLTPYVGGGLAAVYRKTYRTGADASNMQPGYSLTVGANTPIDKGHLLGLDLRFSSVANEAWVVDPVYLTRRPSNTMVSAKFNYSLTY